VKVLAKDPPGNSTVHFLSDLGNWALCSPRFRYPHDGARSKRGTWSIRDRQPGDVLCAKCETARMEKPAKRIVRADLGAEWADRLRRWNEG